MFYNFWGWSFRFSIHSFFLFLCLRVLVSFWIGSWSENMSKRTSLSVLLICIASCYGLLTCHKTTICWSAPIQHMALQNFLSQNFLFVYLRVGFLDYALLISISMLWSTYFSSKSIPALQNYFQKLLPIIDFDLKLTTGWFSNMLQRANEWYVSTIDLILNIFYYKMCKVELLKWRSIMVHHVNF